MAHLMFYTQQRGKFMVLTALTEFSTLIRKKDNEQGKRNIKTTGQGSLTIS
jgi:hypothetical protein